MTTSKSIWTDFDFFRLYLKKNTAVEIEILQKAFQNLPKEDKDGFANLARADQTQREKEWKKYKQDFMSSLPSSKDRLLLSDPMHLIEQNNLLKERLSHYVKKKKRCNDDIEENKSDNNRNIKLSYGDYASVRRHEIKTENKEKKKIMSETDITKKIKDEFVRMTSKEKETFFIKNISKKEGDDESDDTNGIKETNDGTIEDEDS